MRADRLLPWVLRAAWALLPVAAGPALDAALHPLDAGTRVAGSGLAWAVWAAGVVATLVPHPIALTAVRVAAPMALAAALWATLGGRPDAAAGAAAMAATGVALVAALDARVGEHFVNGPAYPNERRLLLRPPGPLLVGMLPLSWAVVAGVPVAVAMLAGAGRIAVAGAVALVGVPVAVVLARALHGLARRWVVLVPAGVVVHDPIALTDPVLFRRETVRRIGPADAGSTALDLTQAAPGLALEIELDEEVQLHRTVPGQRLGVPTDAGALLVTPTRPGALLEGAAGNRLPVAPPA